MAYIFLSSFTVPDDIASRLISSDRFRIDLVLYDLIYVCIHSLFFVDVALSVDMYSCLFHLSICELVSCFLVQSVVSLLYLFIHVGVHVYLHAFMCRSASLSV